MKSRLRLDLNTCGFEEEAISKIGFEEDGDAPNLGRLGHLIAGRMLAALDGVEEEREECSSFRRQKVEEGLKG